MSKTYTVYVTVYHKCEVEADSPEAAKDEATEVIWDDHIKDVVIDVEETEDWFLAEKSYEEYFNAN